MRTSVGLACIVFAAFGSAACSSTQSASPGPNKSDAGGGDGSTVPSGPIELQRACADSIDSVYGDPGALPADKGAIIKCAADKVLNKADFEAAARAGADGYTGKPFTSGAKIFRVLYRTERGNDAKTPGYSAALVFLPDTPVSGTVPVIVSSHGAVGQAADCVPSKFQNSDYIHQIYPLVGQGFAVIAPDYAGYANFGAANNPPSAFASVADIGKSILDGARALKTLIPARLSDKVVITGHSQGGHSALGALSQAESYAPDLKIAGVAVYAPLWQPQRSWGAIFVQPNSYPIASSAGPAVSLWYHYTHAELLDGPGKGIEVFAESKRADIKKFVDSTCWGFPYTALEKLGTTANDLFDPTYVSKIKNPAAGISECNGDPLCDKWMKRFLDDRPKMTGTATKVPIFLLYGTSDTTITPDLMACVFDRLKADKTALNVCLVPGEGHNTVVSKKADMVSDWIASIALGAPAPAACAVNESGLTTDAGAPVACNPILPND